MDTVRVKFVYHNGVVAAASVFPDISLAELKTIASHVVLPHLSYERFGLTRKDEDGDDVYIYTDAEVAAVLATAAAHGNASVRFPVVGKEGTDPNNKPVQDADLVTQPSLLLFVAARFEAWRREKLLLRACGNPLSHERVLRILLEHVDFFRVWPDGRVYKPTFTNNQYGGLPSIAIDDWGQTVPDVPPIWYSIYMRNAVAAKILIEKGANFSATPPGHSSALFLAVQNGLDDIAVLLLQRGARSMDMPVFFHYAIGWNCHQTVRAFVTMGLAPDLEKASALDMGGYPWSGSLTPLERAIAANATATALFLLEGQHVDAAAQSDANAMTPLHRAVKARNVDVARALLVAGADVNGVVRRGAAVVHRPPLFLAVLETRDVAMASLLLEHGADPDWTPSPPAMPTAQPAAPLLEELRLQTPHGRSGRHSPVLGSQHAAQEASAAYKEAMEKILDEHRAKKA
jgi:ankyrin repeat protein